MIKLSIREFKLASRGGDELQSWLDEHGAFVGGVALLTKDNFGDFAPLPRRKLETVLSADTKSSSISARGCMGWRRSPGP